jgi:hypothetical protein
MAVVNYQYCNASLGRTITIQFDQGFGASYTIVGHNVGGNCNSAQPQIIAWIPSPLGLSNSGFLEPINVAPYARYVSLSGSDCSAFAFGSIDVGNATNNLTADGSLIVNVVGKRLYTSYRVSGPSGTIDQADTVTPNAHVFTGLKPGVYMVTVTTLSYDPFGGSVPCVIQQQVVVGQNAVICDLGLGSIVTESAQGAANGKIQVLNVTGFQASVEYRIDAGAWQDSAEFSGLAAGTYNVQVRYKDYNSCTANRNVTVEDDDSCDISISVSVIHEQSKFASDGVIEIIANGSQGPYQYSIDDGDTYQDEPTFSGLAPGTYPVRVQDAAGCEDVREVIVYRYKRPFIDFPKVNSHRVVLQTSPTLPVRKRQNFDNTLFAEMRLPGVPADTYFEKVERVDTNTLQFRSSYLNNYARVYSEAGVQQAVYTPNRISDNMNRSESLAAMFVNLGGGKVQVFFETGLPYYAEVGMDLVITDNVDLAGTYEVEDILQGVGLAEGYQVLVITADDTPAVVGGTATFQYDAEPYESYEVDIPWAAFAEGKYYLVFDGNDPQFANYTAKSEPVDSRDAWPDLLLVEYRNNDNKFGIDYSTGIKHRMRVDAELNSMTFGGDRTVYTDSKARTIKLEEINKQYMEFTVFDVPWYLLERSDLAFSMDWFAVEDVEYQSEEDFEPEYFKNDSLHNGKIKLVKVEYENENSDDTGTPDVDILGLDLGTVMGVL